MTEDTKAKERILRLFHNTEGPIDTDCTPVVGYGEDGEPHGVTVMEGTSRYRYVSRETMVFNFLTKEGVCEKLLGLESDPEEVATEGCRWTGEGDGEPWVSDCGTDWEFFEGGPKSNGMNFCPKCGNPCVEVEQDSDWED